MRRHYYIQPSLQHAFTLLYSFLSTTEVFVFGLFILVFEKLSLDLETDLLIYWKFSIFLLIIISISAFNFWVGVRLSHRIAGPMVQIHRALHHAISGNYETRVQMRSSDYLHEIGDDLNILLQKLEREKKNPQKNPEIIKTNKRK